MQKGYLRLFINVFAFIPRYGSKIGGGLKVTRQEKITPRKREGQGNRGHNIQN